MPSNEPQPSHLAAWERQYTPGQHGEQFACQVCGTFSSIPIDGEVHLEPEQEVPAWQGSWDRALGELTDDQLIAADAARNAARAQPNASVDDELVNLVDVLRTAQDRIAALAVRTGGLGFTVQHNAGSMIGSAIMSLRSLLPPDRR